MKKRYFLFLLWAFAGFRAAGQGLPVRAEYVLMANLSGQDDTCTTIGI
jgi:hypothetical protein